MNPAVEGPLAVRCDLLRFTMLSPMMCQQYWDRDEKLKFMDRHGIDISFVRYCPFAVILAVG
jgi:hypothetical protein